MESWGSARAVAGLGALVGSLAAAFAFVTTATAREAFFVDPGYDRVFPVDLDTGEVAEPIPVDDGPTDVAIAPDGAVTLTSPSRTVVRWR
jgi:DNA-binding beta-propeller fold protein YncE